MSPTRSHYVHGTDPEEQRRLSPGVATEFAGGEARQGDDYTVVVLEFA